MAVEAAQETVGHDRSRSFGYGTGIHELNGPALFPEDLMQLLQNLPFIRMVGQVKTAGRLVPEPSPGRDLFPDVPASDGAVIHLTRRLADRPDHPEIANGSAYGLVRSFEYSD